MEYICDGCGEKFTVNSEKKPTRCPFCSELYIRNTEEGLKKVAIINGTIKTDMRVIIHQDGHIEFLDFEGEITIDENYEILQSEEINEKQYYKLIK